MFFWALTISESAFRFWIGFGVRRQVSGGGKDLRPPRHAEEGTTRSGKDNLHPQRSQRTFSRRLDGLKNLSSYHRSRVYHFLLPAPLDTGGNVGIRRRQRSHYRSNCKILEVSDSFLPWILKSESMFQE